MSDPARSLDRAREYWHLHGRSEAFLQRLTTGSPPSRDGDGDRFQERCSWLMNLTPLGSGEKARMALNYLIEMGCGLIDNALTLAHRRTIQGA